MKREEVLAKLKDAVDMLRGTSTELGPHTADGERTMLKVNGRDVCTLVQFYGDGRGQVLNIGVPGRRRTFRRRKDGSFRWLDAAILLVGLVNELNEAANGESVIIQIGDNEDYFRLIGKRALREAVKSRDGKAVWQGSVPAEISATNAVDYLLVTGDEDSWRDLAEQLEGEDIDEIFAGT
jgi:hypothetical protein